MVWVIFLAALAYWLELGTRNKEKEKALVSARAFFHQVLITRQWNALHGGVYAQITETTQPNKYLGPQGRDLTADNGLKLTKINPAYMTRQIAELAEKDGEGTQFHITSLKPIRPENMATEWERNGLSPLNRGVRSKVNSSRKAISLGFVTWCLLLLNRNV